MQIKYDAIQQEAIERCLDINSNNRIVSVSGQAGTGKTSLIKDTHATLQQLGYRVDVLAPTGKAAKRVHEATNIRARTCHMGLEYTSPSDIDEETGQPIGETIPKRDKKNPLDADVVIVDEYMMVNWELHRNLIDALKSGACIRMFGDVNQLPPIESNAKLRDKDAPFEEMMKKFASTQLQEVYRQGEGSGILQNARSILRGRIPRPRDDFSIRFTERPIDTLIEYVMECLEDDINYGDLENQLLTPMNKRWTGTVELNPILQTIFRPDGIGIELPRHRWVKQSITVDVGDKVMVTKNMYDLRPRIADRYLDVKPNGAPGGGYIRPTPEQQVFNGETGIVVSAEGDGLGIDLGDRVVYVPSYSEYWDFKREVVGMYNPLRDVDLAYIITTHKAQGSEYQHVTYVMNKAHQYMLCRSNFYTAVTRARKHVRVITDQRGMSYAMRDRRP